MKRLRVALLTLLVVGCVAIGFVVARVRSLPGWAQRPAPDCASGLDGTAEGADHRAARELEAAIVSEVHRIRPAGEPWQLVIPLAAAQAWLDCRLPEWVVHAEDPELRELAAEYGVGIVLAESGSAAGETGGVVVGQSRGGWFVAAGLDAERVGDEWRIAPGRAWLGRQRLPTSLAGWLFGGLPSVELPASWDLVDHRTVTIDAMAVEGGAVRLSCRTLSGSAAAAESRARARTAARRAPDV